MARIDGEGNFRGPFRDFSMTTGQLVASGSYRAGKCQGLVETFHANGQRAAQGEYQNGQQAGEWRYWYADGRPRQTLRFGPAPEEVSFLAYWDEKGNARLQEGQGEWFGTYGGFRQGGAVAAGKPAGKWNRWALSDNSTPKALVCSETFEKGRFKAGHMEVKVVGASSDYRDGSRLMPVGLEEYLSAERFQLGANCASLAASAKRRSFRPASFANGGLANYQQELLKKLMRNLGPYMSGDIEVQCVISENGLLRDFTCTQPGLLNALTTILHQMPAWEPASYDGKSIASSLKIKIEAQNNTAWVGVTPYLADNQKPAGL
ncbi:hypothetical protein GCM10027048_08000 [Hymenobacter coalescens]